MSGSFAPVSIKDLRKLFEGALLGAGWRVAKLAPGSKVYASGDGAVIPFISQSISRSGWFRFDAYVGVILDDELGREFGRGHLICHTANYPEGFGLRPTPFPEDALACLPGWIRALEAVAATLPRDEPALRQCLARDDFAGLPARYFLPIHLAG